MTYETKQQQRERFLAEFLRLWRAWQLSAACRDLNEASCDTVGPHLWVGERPQKCVRASAKTKVSTGQREFGRSRAQDRSINSVPCHAGIQAEARKTGHADRRH
jgi:hypothetical protein